MKMQIISLTVVAVACVVLVATPVAAGTLYSNGPSNGDIDAWTINYGFSVSDSFVVPANSTIQRIDFVYWEQPSFDVLTTVDMQIGATSFAGNIQTLTGLTSTYLGANSFGYNLFNAEYTFPGIAWSGSGFVTLSNACTTDGCSTTPIYWDENQGPSTAYDSSAGMIDSESFTLSGNSSGIVPEPGSMMLFASGVCCLAAVLRRRLL